MARQDLFAGTRRRTHHTTQRTPAEEVRARPGDTADAAASFVVAAFRRRLGTGREGGGGGRRSQAIRSTMTSAEICKYKGLPVPIYRGSTGSRRGHHLKASLITATELLPLYGSQINYSEMRNLIQNFASRTRGRLPRARALASSALGLRVRRSGLYCER